ncbi:hypothetical protein CCP3SC15_2390004 [Gammaproteobacteria bacterium]
MLPEGDDPDSLVRVEGLEAFTARIRQATPIVEYLLEMVRAQVDTERTDRQARVVELTRPFMAKVSPGIYRTLLLQELAGLARIAPDKLSKLMQSEVTQPHDAPPPTDGATGDTPFSSTYCAGIAAGAPGLGQTGR